MNSRERFYAVTHYKPFDRFFKNEMGPYYEKPYEETMERWQREGLPLDDDLYRILGYDRIDVLPINFFPCPGWKHEDLEETNEYVIYRDEWDGVIKKARKDARTAGHTTQFLEYPIKDRQSWNEFKKRLNPESPVRFPWYWESLKKQYRDRDFPLGIYAGSMFGWLRNCIGIENISIMLYDDPYLVHEMIDHITEMATIILKKVVFEIELDFGCMWEDMGYKTASLISPKHVRQFMMIGYRKITDLLHQAGIDIIMLDSDGNVEELIPLWLEVGINYIYPMEVAAGMDVVKLRKKFGRELRMGGGMDKRILASGNKEGIREMVMSKKDLIHEGGYIPGVDHVIPPDISWESFLYYHKLLEEV